MKNQSLFCRIFYQELNKNPVNKSITENQQKSNRCELVMALSIYSVFLTIHHWKCKQLSFLAIKQENEPKPY